MMANTETPASMPSMLVVEEIPDESVGALLQRLRTDRRLSLESLAARAGVHRTTLSRWESGRQRPSIPELETVLATLSATPSERTEAIRLLGNAGVPRAARLLRNEQRDEAARSRLSLPGDTPPGGGDLLRALRFRRGWSQEQVAARLGIHLSTVSRWERGDHWPDAERLHALCTLLGASGDEMTALSTGQLSFGPEAGATGDEDALAHIFRSELAPSLLVGELYAGRDLAYLRLEASLWEPALRRPSLRPLLGEVYAHHANYLRSRQRFIEAGVYAQKALSISDAMQPTGLLPDWAALAAVSAADAAAWGNRPPGPGRAREILCWWLARRTVSAANAAWMYRKISSYLAVRGRYGEAFEALESAAHLSEQIPDGRQDDTDAGGRGFNLTENRRYMAGTLLAAGRGADVLRWLPEDMAAHPVNRVRDALLWSETLFRLGRRDEAHDWIGRAYAEIAAHGLTYRLPDANRIADLL